MLFNGREVNIILCMRFLPDMSKISACEKSQNMKFGSKNFMVETGKTLRKKYPDYKKSSGFDLYSFRSSAIRNLLGR